MVQIQERVETRLSSSEPEHAPALRSHQLEWLPFVVLLALAFALRIWDLGSRAMHHDESLHALYSWYLYVGRGYTHDPLMHGPFLFHFSALLYLLFGDNEVTARLPMVLLGTAAVGMPYFLRHELGRNGAIAAAAMLAFGPIFLYFSRFGHNEAMLMFQSLLVVVGLFGWLRTRSSPWFYTAAIGMALMFSTKVVAFIFGFIVATFVIVALLVERKRPFEHSVLGALRDIGWRRLGTAVAIFFGISGLLYTTFLTNPQGLCTALWAPDIGACAGKHGMLQYWLEQQGVARGAQPWFYYFLVIPLYEIVPVVLALASPFLARRPRSLFFWFCVWWAVLSLVIYSTASEKMPWLVVHPTLPLVMLAALALDGPLSRLHRPWGLAARQWAVAGLAVLSVGLFVAWATIGGAEATSLAAQTTALRRIALALVLAGVLTATARLTWSLPRAQAMAALGVAALGVLLTYSIHTGWQATYKNGDTPVELLVYVQSSPDVPFIVSEVERLGSELGLRKDLPILLDGGYTETVAGQQVAHEAVSWPFEWYFRDHRGKQYFSRNLPSDFASGRYAALLVMGTNLEPIRADLSGYTGNKFRLNWWYPEDYKGIPIATAQIEDMPAAVGKTAGMVVGAILDPTSREKLLKYVLYRELVNPPLGAREMYFYVRNDLARGGPSPAPAPAPPSPAPALPAQPAAVEVEDVFVYGRPGGQPVLRDPKGIALDRDGRLYVVDGINSTVTAFNSDGSVARSWGRRGTGDGEFVEPWGITVAADGSVFVADTWNHRIQKFDAQGRFITKWGISGVGTVPATFYGPRDLATTPAGELLVTDTGNKRIQAFDQRGNYLRSLGVEGNRPGELREPVGLAVDAEGRIYVADTWNQRIQVFDSSFRPIAQYPIPGWSGESITNKPYLAVGPSGEVFATAPDQGTVVMVTDGVGTLLALPAPRPRMPVGIEVDDRGRLFISDAQSASVFRYDLRPASTPPQETPESD